jgi:hypothetical protein
MSIKNLEEQITARIDGIILDLQNKGIVTTGEGKVFRRRAISSIRSLRDFRLMVYLPEAVEISNFDVTADRPSA